MRFTGSAPSEVTVGGADLLPMSRSAGSQFAKRCEETGGGERIVEGVKGDRGRELRRFWAETDLQDILLPDCHERIQFGCGIFLPMGACGENDGSGFVDVPLSLVAFALDHAATVRAPAVSHDVETESRRTAKVRFKSQSFLLLVDAAENPVNRQRTRAELQGDAGIFKTARRELQARVQAEAVQPVEFGNTAFTRAGRLHPAQRLGATAAVVGGKEEIPTPHGHHCADNVND